MDKISAVAAAEKAAEAAAEAAEAAVEKAAKKYNAMVMANPIRGVPETRLRRVMAEEWGVWTEYVAAAKAAQAARAALAVARSLSGRPW